jgi:uncharacterized protein YcfJ
MKNALLTAALAAVIAGPIAVSPPAFAARDRDYDHDRRDRDRRDDRDHHRKCGGGSGTVGTVVGGVGGALAGDAVGGGTVGTVAGGVGGALLGRHIDKKRTADKRGC